MTKDENKGSKKEENPMTPAEAARIIENMYLYRMKVQSRYRAEKMALKIAVKALRETAAEQEANK